MSVRERTAGDSRPYLAKAEPSRGHVGKENYCERT